jgi:hypothetical protein
MKVHAIALAKETGVRLEHVMAAGLQVGYPSIREALDAARELRMPEAQASVLREALEHRQQEARAAAEEILKQKLQAIDTWEALGAFEHSEEGFTVRFYGTNALQQMLIRRKLELATDYHRVTNIWWPEHWHAADFAKLKDEKAEAFAFEEADKARGFNQVWETYKRIGPNDNPSGKLIWEKLLKVARTKEQLKIMCAHFAPYDPRDEEWPDEDAEPHPPSEKYLHFVRKLAEFFPIEEPATL